MKNSKKSIAQRDLEFLSDRNSALMLKSPRGGRIILWVIFIFLVVAVIWADHTTLDERTVGVGTVIPSQQVQQIQNLEGGILKTIDTQVGATVKKGQILMTIDNSTALSSLREQEVESTNLYASSVRLQAEVDGKKPVFSQSFAEKYPNLVAREMDLYTTQIESLKANKQVFQQQVDQKKQEIIEQKAKLENLKQSYKLSSEELTLTRPAFKQGAVSRVELLQLERDVNKIQGDLEATELAIPRAHSALKEAQNKLVESDAKFMSDAQEQLNKVQSKLDQLRQANFSLQDKVSRTQVRSPVNGIVKQIQINTIGGVVKPGMDLIDIVPIDDTLLIEAKVKPKDIGFIKPGLPAMVKLTAYDFSIYGGLKAHVETISADTIVDKDDREGRSYYLVRVRTNHNYLGTAKNPLPIIPGMQATVDIITGKKTLLQYLFKPILKAKQNALHER
ncbi:Type I secretion system membrane fusion protein PrsE [Marinomonas spartinae]|uniref:Membrane fusion protein (MFP) family protein n=1 Tax=Marinomonas spartinae TaxID=1792290 RepID=A0A1A8TE92_9GAMM|nr:HlyD family type I secretion periplasmic adaptor subunit [Marinomonas spartinae]SBS31573.1 Type I secretion system membrane fusion protein PrsE [Marinomonas spartinae]SBS33747.1 Type I secretion system membrane fusion protein PrsE [Marinomonas spartinae]